MQNQDIALAALALAAFPILAILLVRECSKNTKENRSISQRHLNKADCAEKGVPEPEHPSPGQHRSAEQRHWRRQNVLAMLALVAAVVAAAGAWETFIQTRRQASAAENQISVMRDQEIRQLRAYVIVLPKSISFDNMNADPVTFTIVPVVKVTGPTPARKLGLLSLPHIQALPSNLPWDYLMPDSGEHIRSGWVTGSGFPGVDMPLQPIVGKVTAAEIKEIFTGQKRLYVWGLGLYFDVFRYARLLPFCFSYSWSGFFDGGAETCSTKQFSIDDDQNQDMVRDSPAESARLDALAGRKAPHHTQSAPH